MVHYYFHMSCLKVWLLIHTHMGYLYMGLFIIQMENLKSKRKLTSINEKTNYLHVVCLVCPYWRVFTWHRGSAEPVNVHQLKTCQSKLKLSFESLKDHFQCIEKLTRRPCICTDSTGQILDHDPTDSGYIHCVVLWTSFCPPFYYTILYSRKHI